MRCQNCKRELGDGLLPARCPHCGQSPRKESPHGSRRSKRNLDQIVSHTRISKMQKDNVDAWKISRVAKKAADDSKKRAKILLLFIGFVAALFAAFVLFSYSCTTPQVPDVVGWQEARAKTALEEAGYNVERTEETSQTINAGMIIKTDPPASTHAARGTNVTMTVALARIMPDVIGKTQEEATAACDNASIPYKIEEEASDKPEGTVLNSSVNAGETVEANQTVVLTVATSLRVPHVVGLTQAEADSALRALNLVPQVKYQYSADESQQGIVLSSDPTEGAKVAENATVTITIASSEQGQAQATADAVIDAVYGATPSGDSIGVALAPYLSPSSGYVGKSAHDIWWGLIKRGGLYPDQSAALQSLPRSLISKNITISADGKSASATVKVHWLWDPMGSRYSGVTSNDTHNITMTFDDQGLLVSFYDSKTDVPTFNYG